MKILQAVASSNVQPSGGSQEYELVTCSKEMPKEIKAKALGFRYPADGGGKPAHSLKTTDLDGESWLLMNRIIAADGGAYVSHTLAFRVQGMARSLLGGLLDEMKQDFTDKAQEKSGDAKKKVETIIAQFRRDVTALQNRVEQYSNSKWWVFGGEEEIKRQLRDIEQQERTAKNAAEEELKGYREKLTSVLRLLPGGKPAGTTGPLAEPSCFPDLLEKFEALATDYRNYSRIVAICDRCNLAEATVADMNAASAKLGEQLAEAKRELEVSKLSDKIMSSKMKGDRKDNARAKAGKSSMMSWQTTTMVALSLAVVVLLAKLIMSDPADQTIDATDAAASAKLQMLEWSKERAQLNEEIKKLKAGTSDRPPLDGK